MNLNGGSQLTVNGTNIGQTATNVDCLNITNGIVTGTNGICAGTTNFWQLNNGAISQSNLTNDVLFGGIATNSAKFAFLNNASGTPTASVAGNLIVMPTIIGGNQVGGSLGIGTTTPAYNLDVVGTGHFINNGNPILTVERSGAASNATIQYKNAGGSFYSGIDGGDNFSLAYNNSDVGTNPMFTITSGGAVGINAKAPNAKFEVRANASTVPIASFSGQSTFAGLVVDNKGSGDLFTASIAGASKFTVLNNGNIRINNLGLGVVQSDATGLISSSALNLANASLCNWRPRSTKWWLTIQ